MLRGGIAERGGVRVGHRIIEINNQSVVAVPHEKIVNLLATSVGEVLIFTYNKFGQEEYKFVFILDIDEDNANVYVSIAYWPGESGIYLISIKWFEVPNCS